MENLFKKHLLPAVTLNNVHTALQLAETFLSNGLNIMEVPFRTPAAAKSIRAICDRFPEMHIGAGTLLSQEQVTAAIDAGAEFGLSPGRNKEVTKAVTERSFPFIPGVATPSEIEEAFHLGFNILKIFPVKTLGKTSFLKSIAGPYGHLDLQFIPMGGVNINNVCSYLKQPLVVACGGSWLTPRHLLEAKEFSKIGEIVCHSLKLIEDLEM